MTAGFHLTVEESNNGDRVLVGPIVDDVLFDGANAHSDRQVISRFTKIRNECQPLQSGRNALRIDVSLMFSSSLASKKHDIGEVRSGVGGKDDCPVTGRHRDRAPLPPEPCAPLLASFLPQAPG